MIRYIVVHCSDSPNDRDSVDAEEIHSWHKDNGWDGIGYHYVIKRDGSVEEGRPLYWTGAHVRSHNAYAIGICLVGRDEYTNAQLYHLRQLIHRLEVLYPKTQVLGHRDLDKRKTCPNFDVSGWYYE